MTTQTFRTATAAFGHITDETAMYCIDQNGYAEVFNIT